MILFFNWNFNRESSECYYVDGNRNRKEWKRAGVAETDTAS